MKAINQMFAIALCCALMACEKGAENGNEIPDIKEYTLNLGKESVNLGYLQRDTITIANTDMTKIKWIIAKGDSCISIIGNVIVGRRKGEASLIALHNGEAGKLTVNVTSDEYIPVEKVLFEINGKVCSSGDTLYFPTCEWANVKWLGTEPANATWQKVHRALLWSTLSDGEGSITNNEKKMFNQQGIDTAIVKFKGFFPQLSNFRFLVHPTVEHGIWLNIDHDNPDNNLFLYNDSIPSWVFDVHLEVWPRDIKTTAWDYDQLKKNFSVEVLQAYPSTYCKRICFTDIDNRIEIVGDGDTTMHGYNKIYIRAGETRELAVKLFAPEQWHKCITWSDPNINDKTDYKLELTSDGKLSLPADFSIDDLKGLGYSEKELAADTVYIGKVIATVMGEPYKSEWLKQLEHIKWNFPKVEPLKSRPASIYWIKSMP